MANHPPHLLPYPPHTVITSIPYNTIIIPYVPLKTSFTEAATSTLIVTLSCSIHGNFPPNCEYLDSQVFLSRLKI